MRVFCSWLPAMTLSALLAYTALAHVVDDRHPALSLEAIDTQLQACPIVQQLSAEKAVHHAAQPDALLEQVFRLLFPASPAVNALLGTLYITAPPSLLLMFCPADIDPASLSIMVAFAVGGLMGDTLFHLLPEIFLGEEDAADAVKLVLVEPNRNLLLGLAILVGFMTFVAMDKGLRIATGGSGHDHSHGHARGPAHQDTDTTTTATSTSIDATSDPIKLTKRKGTSATPSTPAVDPPADEATAKKHNGYLNIIADFTHNITDGLAMSASFYASPTVGASTALAVFLHEVPHQVGDLALLIQSGFSKRAAIAAQFMTSSGAFLGTLIGIAVHEWGHADAAGDLPRDQGLWGTSLTWGDLLLPFTAGTFLFVGTVAAIPEILETDPALSKKSELAKTLKQFSAVALGAGTMLYMSWH